MVEKKINWWIITPRPLLKEMKTRYYHVFVRASACCQVKTFQDRLVEKEILKLLTMCLVNMSAEIVLLKLDIKSVREKRKRGCIM